MNKVQQFIAARAWVKTVEGSTVTLNEGCFFVGSEDTVRSFKNVREAALGSAKKYVLNTLAPVKVAKAPKVAKPKKEKADKVEKAPKVAKPKKEKADKVEKAPKVAKPKKEKPIEQVDFWGTSVNNRFRFCNISSARRGSAEVPEVEHFGEVPTLEAYDYTYDEDVENMIADILAA